MAKKKKEVEKKAVLPLDVIRKKAGLLPTAGRYSFLLLSSAFDGCFDLCDVLRHFWDCPGEK